MLFRSSRKSTDLETPNNTHQKKTLDDTPQKKLDTYPSHLGIDVIKNQFEIDPSNLQETYSSNLSNYLNHLEARINQSMEKLLTPDIIEIDDDYILGDKVLDDIKKSDFEFKNFPQYFLAITSTSEEKNDSQLSSTPDNDGENKLWDKLEDICNNGKMIEKVYDSYRKLATNIEIPLEDIRVQSLKDVLKKTNNTLNSDDAELTTEELKSLQTEYNNIINARGGSTPTTQNKSNENLTTIIDIASKINKKLNILKEKAKNIAEEIQKKRETKKNKKNEREKKQNKETKKAYAPLLEKLDRLRKNRHHIPSSINDINNLEREEKTALYQALLTQKNNDGSTHNTILLDTLSRFDIKHEHCMKDLFNEEIVSYLDSYASTLGKGGNGATYTTLSSDGNVVIKLQVVKEKNGTKDAYIKRMKEEYATQKQVYDLTGTDSNNHITPKPYYLTFSNDQGYSVTCMDLLKTQSSPENTVDNLVFTLNLAKSFHSTLFTLSENKTVHGDLKMDNVMPVKNKDGEYILAILDWGEAYRYDQPSKGASPLYLLPETNDSKSSSRRDWYAAGITLLELYLQEKMENLLNLKKYPLPSLTAHKHSTEPPKEDSENIDFQEQTISQKISTFRDKKIDLCNDEIEEIDKKLQEEEEGKKEATDNWKNIIKQNEDNKDIKDLISNFESWSKDSEKILIQLQRKKSSFSLEKKFYEMTKSMMESTKTEHPLNFLEESTRLLEEAKELQAKLKNPHKNEQK